jgi:hypothetical protein
MLVRSRENGGCSKVFNKVKIEEKIMAGKTQLTLEESSEAIVTKGGLQVTFNAAGGIEVTVNGKNIVVDQTGKVAVEASAEKLAALAAASPANDSLAQKVLEVGDPLKDGTIVIAVDPDKNTSLRVPEGIFGGESDFDHQDDVVREANAQGLHGHKDWRRVTNKEAYTLAGAWNKVAPLALRHGPAAPWFWGASYGHCSNGRVYRSGESDWYYDGRDSSRPVPVVRSGPARI